MNFIERVMRAMTHINIGAALGLIAWVLWTGWQVVTGQIAPAYRVAEVKALMTLAHRGEPTPMRLVPAQPGGDAPPSCHGEAPATHKASLTMTGADL